MKPYDPKAKCPKCGCEVVDTEYCISDYLRRTCTRCDYWWSEAPLPPQPEPPTPRKPRPPGGSSLAGLEACPDCAATGRCENHDCSRCEGIGWVDFAIGVLPRSGVEVWREKPPEPRSLLAEIESRAKDRQHPGPEFAFERDMRLLLVACRSLADKVRHAEAIMFHEGDMKTIEEVVEDALSTRGKGG